MKLHCYKNDLVEALQFAIRAVAVNPMTPALAGIYLKAEGSVLEVQANNFSTGIIARIPANAENPGEVVVIGKSFQEFIGKMPDDTITISDEYNSNALTIRAGGASINLLTLPVNDFPKVKTPETNNSFRIRSVEMKDLIQKTAFAVAKDDSRPVFTGVYFEVKGDKITAVATNTHRLALTKAYLNETYGEFSFIVPADILRGVLMRLEQVGEEKFVEINYSTRYITFSFDNVFVNSRLIEGQFPAYDRVIPESFTTQATVDTVRFKKAIDLVSLMAKENEYNTVKFVFSKEMVEISSYSPETGTAAEYLEAVVEGDKLDISFNVDYMADFMRITKSKTLNIYFNDRHSPAKFTEPGDPYFVYVATPVRT